MTQGKYDHSISLRPDEEKRLKYLMSRGIRIIEIFREGMERVEKSLEVPTSGNPRGRNKST